MRPILAVTLALAIALGAGTAAAPQGAEALRREAYDAAYNMDFERSMELFRQALAGAPNDPATLRGAASVIWLRVLFLRGTVLVEDYLGRVRGTDDVKMPEPPPDLDKAFEQNVQKAIALAEKEVDGHYNEAWSHYELSASLGVAASYAGTIKGSMWGALKLARRSFSEGEMVLKLDPKRKDAGLVLGTYRYLVASLPMAVRLMAYIVGFGGGKEEGIRLIEEASRYPSDVQTDARFALVLMYNREQRYADAVKIIQGLEQSYPRNRLLWLEEGSTLLRGDRPADALKVLDGAMARLPQDSRVRMPGEEVRWHLKRGIARLRTNRLEEAEQDLRAAAGKGARGWVLARVHIELGKLADLRGDRTKAKAEYRSGAALATSVGDDEAANEANRLISKGYRQ